MGKRMSLQFPPDVSTQLGYDPLVRINDKLKARCVGNAEYTADEVEKVSHLTKKLFRGDTPMPIEVEEQFRRLCRFTEMGLPVQFSISSHRKFVGPVIVFMKRCLLALLRPVLADTMTSIRSFCELSVMEMAQQRTDIESLKARLLLQQVDPPRSV